MKLTTFIYSFFIALLLTSPAIAVEEITQNHIKVFSLTAPEKLTFSGIDLSNLDANSNTTIYMHQSQGVYTFQINATKSYGTYCKYFIKVTDPEGNIQTENLSTVSLINNNYDLHIQHYYTLWNSTYFDESYDLDIYTTLSPLSAEFDYISPKNYTVESFYQVSAESDSYYDLILYAVTGQELQVQQENQIIGATKEALGDAFNWTWDAVVSAISKIPYIGAHLVAILQITALTLSSIIFYTDLLFIQYAETTFLTVEFCILSYSFTKRGSIWTKFKRVIDSHIRLIELVLNVSKSAVNLFSSIITAIANMIQAIKPI